LNQNHYEVIETTPKGKWCPLELPFLRHELSQPRSKVSTLNHAKQLMSKLGFRMNIDFMFATSYHARKFTIMLSPENEQYASWIALQWNQKE
jgi:hypothetical protein